MTDEKPLSERCPVCNGLVEVRNPTGMCDHLYYPDDVKPSELLRVIKSLESERDTLTERYASLEKEWLFQASVMEGVRKRAESAEAERNKLQEECASWERWNRRCIETKNEWGKKLTEAESERDSLKEQVKALKDERALNDFKEIEKILSDDNRCSPDCIHDNPSPHDCAKCQDLPPWYFDKKKDLGIDNNG